MTRRIQVHVYDPEPVVLEHPGGEDHRFAVAPSGALEVYKLADKERQGWEVIVAYAPGAWARAAYTEGS